MEQGRYKIEKPVSKSPANLININLVQMYKTRSTGILNQLPSNAKIEKNIKKIVFPTGVACPRCGKKYRVYKSENRYRCKLCRKPFSLRSCTWLKGMKLSWQQFWLLLWCWTKQVPVKQSVDLVGIRINTVRFWFSKFRQNIPETEYERLKGIVQVDEAFFGGKKGIAVLAGKQCGERKVIMRIIPHTNPQRQHIWKFLYNFVKPKSTLHTDGASIYRGIDKWWPVTHKRDIHSKFEFGLTSQIEGIFGNLRTFIRRMYHHVTIKKLPEIIREFCLRFSSPKFFESPDDYLANSLSFVPFDR